MKVVVYDDEPRLQQIFTEVLGESGQVVWVSQREDLWKELEQFPDLVVLDVRFEGRSDREGILALQEMVRRFSRQPCPVWVVSRYLGERELLQIEEVEGEGWEVESLEFAWDGESGRNLIRQKLESFQKGRGEDTGELTDEEEEELYRWYEKQTIKTPVGSFRFVVASPAMRRILRRLEAHEGGPVVLLGETGVGKTLLAELWAKRRKAQHEAYLGKRIRSAFRVRNCALFGGVSDRNVVISELFGAEKGVYGLEKRVEGVVEATNVPWGVLVLDEFQALPQELQEMLYHLVDSRSFFTRLGDPRHYPYQGTVVLCSTLDHESLKRYVHPPLWGRIAPFIIEIPPLRERREDLEQFFQINLQGVSFSRRAWEYLIWEYSWPLNMRQLVHAAHFFKNIQMVEFAAAVKVVKKTSGALTSSAAETGVSSEASFRKLFALVEEKACLHGLHLRDIELLWLGYLFDRHGGPDNVQKRWGDSKGFSRSTLYRRFREWQKNPRLWDLLDR